ncbi:transcriptional regulator [Caballeronia mineralivorans PML1(12)]|uniref:Transcriptional regulator n=1 Tax=Caballeronia mineralivorans PML1(12) TaxID=908627 RepID=A0A0J1D2A6_9BURK|nr:GlxA family transcriptional regulator [Caballeronia mineralivorans]KLU26781.1 transcriptional regulator [Caballeronia mineralivorans PML1(12)]
MSTLSKSAFEMSSTGDLRSPRRVGILVLPQFSNLGLALVIEPMAIANWLSQRTLYEWTVLSIDGEPVQATNGMIAPARPVSGETGEFSTIFVIASFEPKKHAKNRKVKAWLRRESVFGAQIGGIETGTEMLAAASLLDGRPAAVHWDNLEGFQEAYPNVKATTQLYTIEPRLITCAGGSGIIDMMLEWIGQHAGTELAAEISQHLLHARIRGTSEVQLARTDLDAAPMNEQVSHAIRLMQESVAAPISCEDLAAAVGLSKRQLERQFKHYTATAPLRYYVSLRLATAHKLLQQTELSVSQVAAATGFDSLEHFSRVYKTKFGCPPSRDRSQSWEAPVMRQRVSTPTPTWRPDETPAPR